MNLTRGIKPIKLAKHLSIGIQTLNMYLDRSEFSHITKKRTKGRNIVLVGVTDDDITNLEDYIYKRKRENRSIFFS